MKESKDKMIQMLEDMMVIREFESTVQKHFAEGEIPGFVHLYLGEEAVAVGACNALEEKDYITSTHRGHGHLLARGGDVNKMMAEIFGKATGYNKGKGGSMHIADVSLGILGANGIVGAGLPIAAGSGITSQILDTGAVTLCFFGDGASNRGTFHEAINLASIWNLPVVFVCENNMYAISMPQYRSDGRKGQNIKDVSDRAVAYGISGVTVDGNDVMAVNEAVTEAVKKARNGGGPSLVECKTYRHRGHFEGDPTVYRSDEELEEWKKKDPISRFKNLLKDQELLDDAEYDELKEKVEARIKEAVDFSQNSPDPDPSEVTTDVYYGEGV
ncbi:MULTISPECIES: thiamine pyrophosphate-dependent dehydrogenase E1 component subunit alpha [unclassified Halanaerobium]|uniref:thiamine pyrophosphate-dependent dehydrogenase E1 component subunit alpha n=1 Tax=unclassified Halanaerobium TaxID=2641197 RepID=UPI000DF29CDD|nr:MULTISPECIES: thiamine pyrophosphate-dependent dehydrogenase E1 component subunit alpha [unclassified Halanaerobium]RCW44130.1 pyruvate dehydrogenase E1 component alpha subunit [Halanaerobium sp. MA284_MarDTE_T2]RCW86988.1 pyruvate dehydrogenase E1 component alpha subunit [Halanaerobium sp. DL-01]